MVHFFKEGRNLSGTIVTSLMVDCPNYSEQKKIGDFFTNLDNLITLHQRKCDETKKSKASNAPKNVSERRSDRPGDSFPRFH